eukprot:9006253-Pyramimonas_sp.AAC.1
MAGRPIDGLATDAFHPNVRHMLFRTNVKFDLPYYNPPAQLKVPEERPWLQDMGSCADGHFGKWVKDELGEWKQDRWSVAREQAEAFMHASVKHGTINEHVRLPSVGRSAQEAERTGSRAQTALGHRATEAAEEDWGDVSLRRKNFSNTLKRLGVSIKAGRPDIGNTHTHTHVLDHSTTRPLGHSATRPLAYILVCKHTLKHLKISCKSLIVSPCHTWPSRIPMKKSTNTPLIVFL